MTRYVYIISEYYEDGAECVCATLDRNRIPAIIDENWPENQNQATKTFIGRDNSGRPIWGDAPSRNEEAKSNLETILKEPDEILSEGRVGNNLTAGWGCIQLHVVALR